MNNYYEECLQTLNKLMDEENLDEVNRILNQELSMPYIPEPYFTKFSEMQWEVGRGQQKQNQTLSFDEVVVRLTQNSDLQIQALTALESMNLHRHVGELKDLLESDILDDAVKKHILMCCKEQNLALNVSMLINGAFCEVSVSEIEDPFMRPEYIEIYQNLRETYETDNPSLFLISIEVLNGYVFEAFPFWDQALNAALIIQNVNDLFELKAL